jgi:protein-tyrosine phosphatase
LSSVRVDVVGVVSAAVEAGPDGLRVTWDLDGDDTGVEIATGPTPEAVDHTHTLTVGVGERSALLDPEYARRRRYVSVSPVGGGGSFVVAERRLPFVGVTNFRDLGGYATAVGTRTRWGTLFRSDALHKFTAEDLTSYRSLGLKAVYDLRGDAERERYPNPFPSTQLSLLSQVSAGSPREEVAAGQPQGPEVGERLLREMYRGMLAGAASLFGRLLGRLAEPDSLPAVFHCTGGKDRTGMTSALLLELLRVPRDLVIDDYELTRLYRRREHQAESYENLLASGLPPEAAAAVLGAPRWAMADTLDDLDEIYGGIDAYLSGPAGLSQPTLDRLRDLLTC